MKDQANVFCMNVLPTIIKHRKNARFLIFSKCAENDAGPATYIHDLANSKTLRRILGAEAFIDYFPGIDESFEPAGQFLFFTNKRLFSRKDWGVKITPEYGKIF
jgi:hypothetical protein